MNPDIQFSFGLCLVFILLVPIAIAGLALLNTGLGRSRSAAQTLTTALCLIATAFLSFFVAGFAVAGYRDIVRDGGPFAAMPYAPAAAHGFFLQGVPWTSPVCLIVLLMSVGVGLASLIPLGAAADRWRMGAACASTVGMATIGYPVFMRWTSGIYVLLGTHKAGLPECIDSGGSGFINVVGGLTALAIAWILGPRQGKYPSKGMPAAIPAHNQVFVLFGCMLAWVGWLGLNSAGAMLYASMRPEGAVRVVINTTFAAAAAALTAAITTRVRFRRPDASLIANGWMAGLVASSAGCATLKPATTIIIGIVAGVLVVLSVEWFELHLKVDDPCGSVSVHAVCGIWGLLAVGIFADNGAQFTAQIVGVATLLGWIFPLTYGLNWVLNRCIPYRVSLDGERQGLDLHELGADAYPEFVVHSDEFLQR